MPTLYTTPVDGGQRFHYCNLGAFPLPVFVQISGALTAACCDPMDIPGDDLRFRVCCYRFEWYLDSEPETCEYLAAAGFYSEFKYSDGSDPSACDDPGGDCDNRGKIGDQWFSEKKWLHAQSGVLTAAEVQPWIIENCGIEEIDAGGEGEGWYCVRGYAMDPSCEDVLADADGASGVPDSFVAELSARPVAGSCISHNGADFEVESSWGPCPTQEWAEKLCGNPLSRYCWTLETYGNTTCVGNAAENGNLSRACGHKYEYGSGAGRCIEDGSGSYKWTRGQKYGSADICVNFAKCEDQIPHWCVQTEEFSEVDCGGDLLDEYWTCSQSKPGEGCGNTGTTPVASKRITITGTFDNEADCTASCGSWV